MGREEQRSPFAGKIINEDAQELVRDDGIKSGRWFVQYQQLSPLRKGKQKAELGLISGGELAELLLHRDFQRVCVFARQSV